MTVTCPCCGQAVNAGATPVITLLAALLGGTHQALLRKLVPTYPNGVSREELFDGVNISENSHRRTICLLRPKLRKHGWTIPNGTTRGTYRLERIEGPS